MRDGRRRRRRRRRRRTAGEKDGSRGKGQRTGRGKVFTSEVIRIYSGGGKCTPTFKCIKFDN
jgi:hypothetical protein